MKKITFIRNNSLYSEPRLVKEIEAAKGLYEYSSITWNKSKQIETYENNYPYLLTVTYGSIKILLILPFWWIFCLKKLFFLKPDIIHACDLEALVPALIYSKFRKVKIVYDIWDAAKHRVPAGIGPLVKMVNTYEKYILNQVDLIIVPDEERFTQIGLNKDYLRAPYMVIYNSSYSPKEGEIFHVTRKKKLSIVYIGVIVRESRGLEHIFYAAEHMPEVNFEVCGYGPDDEYFKGIFNATTLKNIKFGGRVNTEESEEINQSADILISLLDPSVENFRYATSSKVFEAFSLLKPIITTEDTASGRLVLETSWGLVIPYSKESLVQSLQKIQNGAVSFSLDPKKVQKYGWEKMQKELREGYNSLVS